ncbi:Na+/H+ antiporter [Paenarthrobacter sp. DKR-5]|uniref:Na+/H+ antiporter n=1 Tax=Paenarthrobacter sp. DKR-5 TaxID=2835535 RepID=UPI001BDDC87E|nr:Na+/H+ antiporter [Paenarthrobacter sp. DKR-5]MBT1001573.1 Na+/H+ antiporter [Paenarthrobacter sp. DKR-5]
MQGLELVVVLGAVLLAGGAVAGWLRLPAPLVLLVLGAALGFLPLIGGTQLPPDVVLLLFLPALLYWESLNTSLREIRSNLRTISLLATGLVFATAAAVAVVAHAFGLPWSMAIVLGAILAPTDATAVSSVPVRLPRRALTTLRTESLINDGTALVLYSVAVAAAVAEKEIALGATFVRFLLSYGVGIAIGLAAGFLVVWLRRWITEPRLENTLSVLTPFIAYLPAELLEVSGVVAVVTCGLTLSQAAPRVISARTRTQAFGFWQVTTYILNGALFVLIGLQLHRITDVFGSQEITGTLLLCALVIVAVIGIRILWMNTLPYLIRLLDRRPAQRGRRVPFRQRVPLAWSGFRGAVSLAAALAVPAHTDAGAPLPGRDLVIAATFAVILFTLLVQGLTLPAVARWANLPEDPTELEEEILGEEKALEAALEALPDAARELDTPPDVRDGLRHNYEEHLERIRSKAGSDDLAAEIEAETDHDAELRLALLPAKREALIRLRDEKRIDDFVLRRLQSRLDREELRLSAEEETE